MLHVAIIDDRIDLRESMALILREFIPDGWECNDYSPIPDIDGYVRFINDNKVSVLILDEKLHEQAGGSFFHVDYNGHHVAAKIREYIPDFPIHIITGFKTDEDLQDSMADIDSIYDRNEFAAEPEKIVRRFIRSANRFNEANNERLAEYCRLSESAALGNLNGDGENRLSSLKQSLNLQYAGGAHPNIGETVSKLEDSLMKMEGLFGQLDLLLKGGG